METQQPQPTLSERAVDLSRKASIAMIATGASAGAMAAPPDVGEVVTTIGAFAAGIGLIGAAWMGINALIGGIRKMNAAARG